MSEGLFSTEWYRVAELHPQLRKHIHVHRQVTRGQTWYVLADGVTGRMHRLDRAGYQFVGQLDGQRSVDEIWQLLVEHLHDAAPSQDDVVRLIGQMHQSDLIQAELAPDVEELFYRQDQREHQRRWSFLNPLAFRVPLLDPSRLLDFLAPRTRWLTRPGTLILWAFLVAFALVTAAQQWTEIREFAATRLPTAHYWLLVWLCFPVLKALHELGHALMLRHWGGSVHEMGVSVLVLMPIPYVDASATALLPDKHQRMLVSAAGIMVEVFCAALALVIWVNIEDSLARDIAFVVMSVGGVSTVLFNGNPLLKYDGYHVLADALEIPNLAGRSRQFWGELARRHLLRVTVSMPLDLARGEAKWLVTYGASAWVYRLFVMVLLAGWIGAYSLALAAALVATFLFGLVFKPAYQIVRYLLESDEIDRHRARAWLSSGGLLAGVALFLALAPLPYATLAQGVVWLPDEAKIRAGVTGSIVEFLVTDGTSVTVGEPLILLRNDALLGRKREIEAQLSALGAQLHAVLDRDPAETHRLREEIDSVRGALARIDQEAGELVVRSTAEGRVVLPSARDQIGTHVARGSVLGYVLSAQALQVRAAVPQADAAMIHQQTERVDVRLVEQNDRTLVGILGRSTPSATHQLPSAALGFGAGGRILTDPSDPDGLKAIEPVFVLDVRVPHSHLERVGGRAWVRFDHGHAPLLKQWALRWEQLFLQHFVGEA
ncbi:MAG: PqqD family peptide modification chaperone [Thiotrichales bacterium]